MSLIVRMRRQAAVWWQRTGVDLYGTPEFASPVEIKCRWEDGIQEVVDAQGERRVSKATVYVDRTMTAGDRLKLGDLASDTPDDPTLAEGTYEIHRFDQLPNLKNTETLLTAYL